MYIKKIKSRQSIMVMVDRKYEHVLNDFSAVADKMVVNKMRTFCHLRIQFSISMC